VKPSDEVPVDQDQTLAVDARDDTHRTANNPDEGRESTNELRPGSVIKGRFVIDSIIGRGGMGIVYRAKDLMSLSKC
jgi:hypothetical protein